MTASTPMAVLPDPPAPPAPLGLIAAGGRLPLLVAEGMRRAGHPVRCVGLKGQFLEELRGVCEEMVEAPSLRLSAWGPALRSMGVTYAVMVGRVDKAKMMENWRVKLANRPDLRTILAFVRNRNDRRSHILLAYIADELAREGVHLIDSTAHIQEHMATPGPMTRRKPTGGQQADIELGWPLLQEMLRLDIGQSIAVREGDVVAVEAIEGTDRMIQRAGELAGASWTLLKSARAGHDRRSDVPTIGPRTIELTHACGGRCIALGAGDVIIIDKPDTLALADKLGVAVIGMHPV
jgi:DUF1009 family protein